MTPRLPRLALTAVLCAAAVTSLSCTSGAGTRATRPAHLERVLPRLDRPDRLGQALDMVGFTRSDLGCSPRGYWSRFPNIDHVPHLLPFFRDLFAQPLHTYDFARVMAGALEEHLTPEYRQRYDNAMFKVVHFLGVEKKVVGPRGYDYRADFAVFASQDDGTEHTANPVVAAVEALYAAAGETLEPGARTRLSAQADAIPPPLRPPLARLVHDVADAHQWHQLAFARVDRADLEAVRQWDTVMDKEYEPAADRVAADLDAQSLYHAAQLCVRAAERASRALEGAADSAGVGLGQIAFRARTPLGTVVLTGTGDDRHEEDACAVLVDKGGSDLYQGRIISGARAMIRSTALLADLGDGDDRYILSANAGAGSAASGYIGVPDTVLPSFRIEYTPASNYGTNFALLLDAGGTDQYLEWSDDGQHTPSALWRDGAIWQQPDPGAVEYGNESFGIGMDVEGGTVPEFHRFQRQLHRR